MRRLWLALLFLLSPALAADDFPIVTPGRNFEFPLDHGAHPTFRTEWWYVTGWLKTAEGRDLGFQVTFFRSRPKGVEDSPSRFTPRQVIFAHAALSDARIGHLLHDQRVARQGFGLAEAAIGNTDLSLDGWSLRREHDGSFTAKIDSGEFSLDLLLTPTQPVLLQGEQGFSRKGPQAAEASYYYSLPHLKVTGSAKGSQVAGEAWLDREWSSDMLDPKAIGWDWLAVNLEDGGAVTAFQIRDQDGKALWAGGSWRDAAGKLVNLAPGDVLFEPAPAWHSPHTGADYPIECSILLRGKRLITKPLLADQELDSRPAGGPVYWEGAVTVGGDVLGKGYLELTGYAEKLSL